MRLMAQRSAIGRVEMKVARYARQRRRNYRATLQRGRIETAISAREGCKNEMDTDRPGNKSELEEMVSTGQR